MTQEELRKLKPDGTLAINEIFYSIQGEGRFSGIPMIFIRLNFCSVGCVFCDTLYCWKDIETNNFLYPKEILLQVKTLSKKVKWVCITGGEPLEQQDELIKLCEHLRNNGLKILLETSGSIEIKDELISSVNWLVCSPKKFLPLNFIKAINEIKILVNKKRKIDKIRGFLINFKNKLSVSIQPIEPNPISNPKKYAKELVDLNKEKEMKDWNENVDRAVEICLGTGWRLSLQLHKILGIR